MQIKRISINYSRPEFVCCHSNAEYQLYFTTGGIPSAADQLCAFCNANGFLFCVTTFHFSIQFHSRSDRNVTFFLNAHRTNPCVRSNVELVSDVQCFTANDNFATTMRVTDTHRYSAFPDLKMYYQDGLFFFLYSTEQLFDAATVIIPKESKTFTFLNLHDYPSLSMHHAYDVDLDMTYVRGRMSRFMSLKDHALLATSSKVLDFMNYTLQLDSDFMTKLANRKKELTDIELFLRVKYSLVNIIKFTSHFHPRYFEHTMCSHYPCF